MSRFPEERTTAKLPCPPPTLDPLEQARALVQGMAPRPANRPRKLTPKGVFSC